MLVRSTTTDSVDTSGEPKKLSRMKRIRKWLEDKKFIRKQVNMGDHPELIRLNKRRDIDKLVHTFMINNATESDSEDDELEPSPPKPFVDWPSFNIGIGFVIFFNAIVIGAETDDRSGNSSVIHLDAGIWYLIEIIFTLIFLGELVMRLYYHRLNYFTNPHVRIWNSLDFVIVTVNIVDTFILMPMGQGGVIRGITMLKFIRIIRLIRLVRLFKIFKELWLVAHGLLQSMKTLTWVTVMTIIFLEVCAVLTTRWIGHNDELYDPYFKESGGWDHEIYFKTSWRSMFTLFQVLTLDSWSEDIARHVIKNQPGWIIFFIVFISLTTFGLLNIIIGVVVESTFSTAALDQNKQKRNRDRDRQMVFNQLREIFETADVDGSGTLTIDEVYDAIKKPEIYNKLKMIDFPVDDPQQIFILLDYDDSGELTIEEFITGCIRMKGTAKSKDLLVAQVALSAMITHFHDFETEMAQFQDKLRNLQTVASAIMGHGEHVFLDQREYQQRHPGAIREEQGSFLARLTSHEILDTPWDSGANFQPKMLTDGGMTKGLGADTKSALNALENTKLPITSALKDKARVSIANDSPSQTPTTSSRSPGSPGSGRALEDAPRNQAIEDRNRRGGLNRSMPVHELALLPGTANH